jgi:hypothetical protein
VSRFDCLWVFAEPWLLFFHLIRMHLSSYPAAKFVSFTVSVMQSKSSIILEATRRQQRTPLRTSSTVKDSPCAPLLSLRACGQEPFEDVHKLSV